MRESGRSSVSGPEPEFAINRCVQYDRLLDNYRTVTDWTDYDGRARR
jgi:hypothetical protein